MYRLNNIKIRENIKNDEVIKIALKKYNINLKNVKNAYVYRKSIDARDKKDILYNYSVDVELIKEQNVKNAQQIKKQEI